MSFNNSPTGGTNIGHNYQNSNNIAPTGNIIANQLTSVVPFSHYAATDANRGSTAVITITSPGSGGVSGWYGCIGNNRPATFTGGNGTTPSLMNFFIGGGGSVTNWAFGESINSTYLPGDVLTAVSGTPSINTAGVSLTNAGSGGTPGDYGHSFSATGCAETPSAASNGSVVGIPLTNFSGSMAGSGAVATFTIGGGGTVTAFEIIGTGKSYQVGDVLTASFGGISNVRLTVTSVAGLSAWGITVFSIDTQGTHGLNFTNNIVFNWDNGGPPGQANGDDGGINDSPGGVPGSGAANIWTPNTICPAAQFTGSIFSGTLSTSALLTGTIAIGQNLAGPAVAANTTITGGSGSSWTVSPSQTVGSETMYSYTCTPTTVYAHPERTAETYAALLGLTASIDGYMYGNGTTTGVLNNAKWNWSPAYTANNGINPYIRAGFQ
jgi:hypothetical protein